MKKPFFSSLLSARLWGENAPERVAYNCAAGNGSVSCPLKGLARVEGCATCEWASEVKNSGGTATVRCNPSLTAIIARAQAAEV